MYVILYAIFVQAAKTKKTEHNRERERPILEKSLARSKKIKINRRWDIGCLYESDTLYCEHQ